MITKRLAIVELNDCSWPTRTREPSNIRRQVPALRTEGGGTRRIIRFNRIRQAGALLRARRDSPALTATQGDIDLPASSNAQGQSPMTDVQGDSNCINTV